MGGGINFVEGGFSPMRLVGLPCVGSSPVTLIGYIGGEEVVRWEDSENPLPSGGMGLYLASTDVFGEATFDEFTAVAP